MDNGPAVSCARPRSDTPKQGYNAQLVSNHGESLYERRTFSSTRATVMSAMCCCAKIIGVTEGCIRVIQWSHTTAQRHLRSKQWVESNEVIEIVKLNAQKELLVQRHHLDYPCLQVIYFFVSETHTIFVNGCPMHDVGF